MKLKLIAAAAVAMLCAQPALAVDTGGVSETTTSPTLSVTSGNCLAVNPYRRALTLDNTGGSIAIGYCRTSPSTPSVHCTAAIGSGGTTTLAAGQLHYWRAGSAPQNEICFIAASGTPTVTIVEGQ